MGSPGNPTSHVAALVAGDLRPRRLSRKKLSEMVEEELEKLIRRGGMAEGEQLPSERELMAVFAVGRPSVREALASLRRKGLVRIANGERARVRRPSAETLLGELSGMARDILSQPNGVEHFEQLRQFLESGLVRYAAEHATAQQVSRLEEALALNGRALDDNEFFMRSDIGFHRVISEIPGNPILPVVHGALLDWLIGARAPIHEDALLHRHNAVSYEQHTRIFEAIRARDPDRAERALKEHLRSVYKAYYAQP